MKREKLEEKRRIREIKKEKEKEVRLAQALRKYPFLALDGNMKKRSTQTCLTYVKALEIFPDLKGLPVKMAILAYRFRREQLEKYGSELMTELANARCNFKVVGFKPSLHISEDLPALKFDKECIICHEEKKTVSLCPECWQLIRKCLKLKGMSHRKGWTGWGYEMNLDLRNLIDLLKSDEEGRRLLEEARQCEGHLTIKT